MKVEEIHPYSPEGDKGRQVEQMFDSIARRYDFMNSAMSMGQHKRWRNKALMKAIASLPPKEIYNILDVACGTGDISFSLEKMLPDSLITGIDISDGMLDIARMKLSQMPADKRKNIVFGKGDSLAMPFHDSDFDFITVAYGVRNFSDLRKGLEEMRRVLKRGGVLCIIELSTPRGFVTKPLYKLYSGKVIPLIGKLVTGDKEAYSYLPESISACPQRDDMSALLYACGFTEVSWKSLSFGALTYYIAK